MYAAWTSRLAETHFETLCLMAAGVPDIQAFYQGEQKTLGESPLREGNGSEYPSFIEMVKTLAALLVCVSTVLAQEPGASGVYTIMRYEQSAGPGLREVRTAWSLYFVSLGSLLPVKDVEIHGSNNANSMYNAVVRYSWTSCGGTVLQLDGALIGSNGSSEGADCTRSFSLTRAQAARAEVFFGVTRRDRHEIGAKLRSKFSVSPAFELVVRIENPAGEPPVHWVLGGSQRGLRDNQFSMRITRDGQPLAVIDAPSMGGISALDTFKPGETVELRAPISSWGDISRPGRYVVQGTFYTELSPIGVSRQGCLACGDRWDRSFQGTVTFQVR
jgi:hypothetical protein